MIQIKIKMQSSNIIFCIKASRFQFENIEFDDTKLIPFLLNKKDKEIEDFVYPKTYSELGSFKRKERMQTDIFKVFANFDSFLFMTTFGKDRDSSWVDYYIKGMFILLICQRIR